MRDLIDLCKDLNPWGISPLDLFINVYGRGPRPLWQVSD